MSTREGLSTVQEPNRSEAYEGDASQTTVIAAQATRRRTRKRFEIVFFIRKLVNGWIVFYKQFPPSKFPGLRPTSARPQGSEQPMEAPHALAMSSRSAPATGDPLDPSGGVEPLSDPPMGNDDGGPIGSTSYEFGVALQSVSETTDGGDGT